MHLISTIYGVRLDNEIKGNIKKNSGKILMGACIHFEMTIKPPTKKISESSSDGSYHNTDNVRLRNRISRVVQSGGDSSYGKL
jgi:hypothetical protein